MTEKPSGWETDAGENLSLTVVIAGERICLATVTAIPRPASTRRPSGSGSLRGPEWRLGLGITS